MSVGSDTQLAAAPSDLSPAQQQALLDYVNATAAVTSYATAVAQTQLPSLVLTPGWYADYLTSFEQAQAHALTWLNGLLPEITGLPPAVIDTDPLVQERLSAVTGALSQLAANPSNPAVKQAVQAALTGLQSILLPVQQAVDNLDRYLADFIAELGTDLTTLQSMATAATAAAGADQAEVAKLNGIIAQLQQAIATREEIANLENMLKGDLTIFVVVVAATIGWFAGPIIDGLLGMALIGISAGIGKKVASEADVTELQDEISNVQQEISSVAVEVVAIQATVAGFEKLVNSGSDTQQALALVTGNWTADAGQIDAVLTDLGDAQARVSAGQVAAAQAEMAALATQWAAQLAAMQLLAGVSVQAASEPVPIAQS